MGRVPSELGRMGGYRRVIRFGCKFYYVLIMGNFLDILEISQVLSLLTSMAVIHEEVKNKCSLRKL